MLFEISLPQACSAYALKRAGLTVESFVRHLTERHGGLQASGLALKLPDHLDPLAGSVSVTILEMVGTWRDGSIRLLVGCESREVERRLHTRLMRYSCENDGGAVAEAERAEVISRIEAILASEGHPQFPLRRGTRLSEAAITRLMKLSDSLDPYDYETLALAFANSPVSAKDRYRVCTWLLELFQKAPDPFDRAQLSLRIAENVSPPLAPDLIALIQDRSLGESRAGLLDALARTKHPDAASVIASVIREHRLAWMGIQALGRLRAVSHLSQIMPFLSDSDAEVRRQAKKVLRRLGFDLSRRRRSLYISSADLVFLKNCQSGRSPLISTISSRPCGDSVKF